MAAYCELGPQEQNKVKFGSKYEYTLSENCTWIESVKTTFMKNVSTGILDENKEHYLRCKNKDKKSYDVWRHMQIHMPKYQ